MQRLTLSIGLAICAQGAYAGWQPPAISGIVTDPSLPEISGLAVSTIDQDRLWIINDSDNGNVIHMMNPKAEYQLSLSVNGVANIDWEDLASFRFQNKNYLLIADTGDNGGIRKESVLHLLEEPNNPVDGQSITPIKTIRFQWPDGPRDCEAVAVDPVREEILLISKKHVPPEVFRLPLKLTDDKILQTAQHIGMLENIEQPDTEVLEINPRYGRYRSQISGAAISRNTRVLAVLNYHHVYLYIRNADQDWNAALKTQAKLSLPWIPQAEGISFTGNSDGFFVASEKRPAPLLRFRYQK